jgi:hypothetical protein
MIMSECMLRKIDKEQLKLTLTQLQMTNSAAVIFSQNITLAYM